MIRSFAPKTDVLADQVVLVTGGTGSFGRRFVRRALEQKPRKLIVFSRDELKQYEMQAELRGVEGYGSLRFFLGDVRDRERLTLALRGVDIVIHAAALKQVPAAEYNPSEFVHTNVLGAENVVWASLANRVQRVVALSTDKGCYPTTLYGATKLMSERIFVAANNLAGDIGSRFCVVRYGNVLGSRASVIPLFQRLIAEGATELPITDPRMSRFWISLDQGVDFVLSSMEMSRGGEVFVPKLPSMKVAEVSSVLAPHLCQRIIGTRGSGEKLDEVMVAAEEASATVELPDRYVIEPEFVEYARVPFKAPRVPEGFVYSSATNHERLEPTELLSLL